MIRAIYWALGGTFFIFAGFTGKLGYVVWAVACVAVGALTPKEPS